MPLHEASRRAEDDTRDARTYYNQIRPTPLPPMPRNTRSRATLDPFVHLQSKYHAPVEAQLSDLLKHGGSPDEIRDLTANIIRKIPPRTPMGDVVMAQPAVSEVVVSDMYPSTYLPRHKGPHLVAPVFVFRQGRESHVSMYCPTISLFEKVPYVNLSKRLGSEFPDTLRIVVVYKGDLMASKNERVYYRPMEDVSNIIGTRYKNPLRLEDLQFDGHGPREMFHYFLHLFHTVENIIRVLQEN